MDGVKKKALTVLVSWLEATATQHQVVIGDSQIDVVIGTHPIRITEEMLGLRGTIEEAMPIFWGITEKAGVGRPKPDFRQQFTGSLAPNEDNDLVAMRHTEFRKVPNNPVVFLRDDYRKIVSWAVSRFFRFNRMQLKQLGYEPDDLRTYAWLYVMNFHGLWRDTQATERQNGSALCNYLQQRFFTDFRKLVTRKSLNVVVDQETANMALGVQIVQQWDPGAGEVNSYPVAVSIEKDVDSGDKFEALPVKTQMNKLVKFMKTRKAEDMKQAASVKLLELPNLTPTAKKQVYKFHREHLSELTENEKAEHAVGCRKCNLLSDSTPTGS